MPVNLRGRHLLSLKDYSPREIAYLLDLSRDLKRKKRAGIRGDLLAGRNIVIIFEKTSTRTRCAFETAVYDEGGQVTFLTNSQMGKKESIEDTARVLGRYYDGIEFRGFKQETVDQLAKYAGVPVWNGLTDLYHPTQVLADLLTIREFIPKPLDQVKLAYVGDARNNMAHSLMIGASKMGLNFSAAAPPSLLPSENLVEDCKRYAVDSGSDICITSDISEAVYQADVIYTDVWVSMGEEDQFAERIKLLKPYQVNQEMIEMTENPDTRFMHCLPAFHDLETEVARQVYEEHGLEEMEVSDEVFRSPRSIVFDQAENRMHTIKAIMVATAGRI